MPRATDQHISSGRAIQVTSHRHLFLHLKSVMLYTASRWLDTSDISWRVLTFRQNPSKKAPWLPVPEMLILRWTVFANGLFLRRHPVGQLEYWPKRRAGGSDCVTPPRALLLGQGLAWNRQCQWHLPDLARSVSSKMVSLEELAMLQFWMVWAWWRGSRCRLLDLSF